MLEQSSSSAVRAPSIDRFPAVPASWYLFGPSADVHQGPVSKRLLDRRLLAFRTATGTVAVLDANCAHMGTDLGHGRVIGETVQCPFHNWRYGVDGVCKHIPGMPEIPRFARVRSYPVTERHGYIFFFSGPEPLFPLPFFFGENPEDFVAGRPFRYVADCPWYLNAANGFDMQHFLCVHGRELVGSCQIDSPAAFARRNRYRARIVGDSIADRFLRSFVGRTVDVSITCWGGPYMMMTARFEQAESRFVIVTQPRDDGTTLCEGIVFIARSRNRFMRAAVGPLSLFIRRWLTYQFVAHEARHLRQVRYDPATLLESDATMADFLSWLVELPSPVEESQCVSHRSRSTHGEPA